MSLIIKINSNLMNYQKHKNTNNSTLLLILGLIKLLNPNSIASTLIINKIQNQYL